MRRIRARLLLLGAVAVLMAATMTLAAQIEGRRVRSQIVPPAPTLASLRMEGLGDEQFVFRSRSLQLQHLGNLGGEIIPFKDMDYTRLADWFYKLDALDARSNVVPISAAFLFGATQRREDVAYVVEYLADHARRDPGRKWRWLAQAVYLARYRQGDRQLALDLARELAGLPVAALPGWARQLEVFVLRDIGQRQAARALLLSLLETADNLSDAERRWIVFYLQTQLAPGPGEGAAGEEDTPAEGAAPWNGD